MSRPAMWIAAVVALVTIALGQVGPPGLTGVASAAPMSVATTAIEPVATDPAATDPAATDPTGTEPVNDGIGAIFGPGLTLDATEMAPGGRLIVTLDGFSSLWATVMVCGNEARRGTPDCNQTASTTKEFPTDGSPLRVSLAVTSPPVDCPCVVRAVGRDSSEIAIAPLVITGHPVGPVVEPDVVGPLMSVSVAAELVSPGAIAAIRAQLGGPATYEVTVTIVNTSTGDLRDVQLSGSGTRGTTLLATLAYQDPGPIAVGQRWTQTVTVTVPAPSFGELQWEAVASGAGPSVVAMSTSSHRPWMLIAVVLVVVGNIGVLLMRWRVRRRTERGELVDPELSPSGGVIVGGRSAADRAHGADADLVGAGDRR